MFINIISISTKLLLLIFLLSVLSIVNSNANIVSDSILNLTIHILEIFIVFLLLFLLKNKNLIVSKYFLLGIILSILILFKVNNIGDLILARWYLVPLVLFSFLTLVNKFDVKNFLFKRKEIIFIFASLILLVFLFTRSNLGQRMIQYTVYVGYGQFASSVFALFFIFLLFFVYYAKTKNRVMLLVSILLLVSTVIILFQSGVKTYLFSSIIWIFILLIRYIFFRFSLKKIFMMVIIIVVLGIVIPMTISKSLSHNLSTLGELMFSEKVLTASGRLPGFFSENNNYSALHIGARSVSEYWINKLLDNPMGYGWYSNSNNLPSFDGAIWEIAYTSGIFTLVLFFIFLFNIVWMSFKLYKRKKSYYNFNIFIFTSWFLIFFIIGGPFNSLLLPFVYILVSFYVIKENKKRPINEN